MFRVRRNLTPTIAVAMLISSAFADTVILKTGERIEGKIVKDTAQQLTLEVKVSAGITDERIVPRAEVERIEKVDPETEIYRVVGTIQPGNNSLSATQYDPAIRTLEAYLKQFPNGAHTSAVQATLREFLAEKKRVEGGEAKLRGQWLSKAEVEKEKVQIGGLLAFEHMKNQSAAGDNIGALNTFAAVEKSYAGAATMPEMIDLAKQLVASIKPGVERAIPEQKVLKARKEKGFASVGAADRAEMIAAYKKEMEQAEATVAAAEAAGLWPPFIVTSEKCLTTLLARVARESTRLAALPVDNMKKSIQRTTTARQKIALAELEAAATALKEATTLWSANELAVRLSKEVAAAQKGSALKKAPATPAPETPKPKVEATPKPSAAIRAAAPLVVAEEEPKPFYMTLPGAIGIVIGVAAVLAGVNIFTKMKAQKSNPAE